MRTHTVTTYRYEELSPKAQERARDWYRDSENESNDWSEFVINDAVEIGGMLGIEFDHHPVPLHGGGTRQDPKIWWALHVQGAGACFEGRYSYAKGGAKHVREHAPGDPELHQIADALQELQRKNGYKLTATVKAGRETYWGATTIDVYKGDEELSTGDATAQGMIEALHEFMRWIYVALDREWDSRQADDYVADQLKDGDHEFTKEGRPWTGSND